MIDSHLTEINYNERGIVMKIRSLLKDMKKVGTHEICFYKHKSIIIYGDLCGKDEYSSDSWWKYINGKRVCRKIHCYIPKSICNLYPEIKEHVWDTYDNGCVCSLPERLMNLIINTLHYDSYMTISAPYYMMVDSMDMME